MRTVFAPVVLLFVATLLLLGGVHAGEKGEKKTLEGTITCAKCDLAKETTCMTVIVAKDKDKKETVYYFDPASSKKNHGKICTTPMQGTVVGTVSKQGEKNIVTVEKVDFKK